jgi:hypothetical protein
MCSVGKILFSMLRTHHILPRLIVVAKKEVIQHQVEEEEEPRIEKLENKGK